MSKKVGLPNVKKTRPPLMRSPKISKLPAPSEGFIRAITHASSPVNLVNSATEFILLMRLQDVIG